MSNKNLLTKTDFVQGLKDNFALARHDLILEKEIGITDLDKIILLILLSRANTDTQLCYISKDKIAEILSVKPKNLRLNESLHRLESIGLVKVNRKAKFSHELNLPIRRNHYEVLDKAFPLEENCKYDKIPRVMIEDLSKTWKERLFNIKIFMLTYSNQEATFIPYSQKGIGEQTGASKPTIIKQIKSLKDQLVLTYDDKGRMLVDLRLLTSISQSQYLKLIKERFEREEKLKSIVSEC